MTAALGYATPARGAVVMAVAPIGLRDRERGTVGFTTSLGFSKKLDRIRREPRVALAYHARELVQRQATQHLGEGRSGRFWDAWLREYYMVRVPVHVHVDRLTVWPDLDR